MHWLVYNIHCPYELCVCKSDSKAVNFTYMCADWITVMECCIDHQASVATHADNRHNSKSQDQNCSRMSKTHLYVRHPIVICEQ